MPHEVVAALIVRSERVLLGLRSPMRALYPDVWDVFGGHVEADESPGQTLVREVQEELAITPTQWLFLETRTLAPPAHRAEPSAQMTVHLYLVTAWSGTPVNRQPEEHSEIGWFSLSQAAGLPLADPVYPSLFARYLRGSDATGEV
jgi:8-oxo-dGTP pyrophosphatase MutT (NUDIX family)